MDWSGIESGPLRRYTSNKWRDWARAQPTTCRLIKQLTRLPMMYRLNLKTGAICAFETSANIYGQTGVYILENFNFLQRLWQKKKKSQTPHVMNSQDINSHYTVTNSHDVFTYPHPNYSYILQLYSYKLPLYRYELQLHSNKLPLNTFNPR